MICSPKMLFRLSVRNNGVSLVLLEIFDFLFALAGGIVDLNTCKGRKIFDFLFALAGGIVDLNTCKGRNFYNDTLVVFADTCQCEVAEEERLINPKTIPLFSIAPNPTTDNIKLLVNQKEAFIIEIKDISGRTIERSYHQELTGELLLPTKLIVGIYFIQLTNTSTHEQNTQKAIIY